MNLTYKNSVADKDVVFVTGTQGLSFGTYEPFDAVSIYMPSNFAAANLKNYDPAELTDEKPLLFTLTAENYLDEMQGDLLNQFGVAFNEGSNISLTIHVIVFNVPANFEDNLEVTATTIEYTSLSAAFAKLFQISYFKYLFSPTYDGGVSDPNYFDLALCLAYLCETETKFSFFMPFVKVALPTENPDINACQIMSRSVDFELTNATAFNAVIPDITKPRAALFWGFMKKIGADRSNLIVHTEDNVRGVQLKMFFSQANTSTTFVGNSLHRLRLTEDGIKATGVPSIFDANVNENLEDQYSELLEAKNVGFLRTISDASNFQCEITSSWTLGNLEIKKPINADMIAKYIDYTTSQQIAVMISDQTTVTNPYKRNEATYLLIQEMLTNNLLSFATAGFLSSITLQFPSYAALPQDSTDFEIQNAWVARYIQTVGKIYISGTIQY